MQTTSFIGQLTRRGMRCGATLVQPSNVESAPVAPPSLPSFLIAGFEGADHRNSSGTPVAMLDATGHAQRFRANYAMLRALGIRVVRESIGWSRSERDGRFDFSCALRRADAARAAGISVVWTLWHYGLPAGLDVFDAGLVDRFSAFAHAAARALHDPAIRAPIFCPVNEISFVAWAVCESCFIHPHRGAPGADASVRGYALKQRLVRAALAGCDAIRDVMPDARMLHVDPLIHIVPPESEPDRSHEAAHARTFQFQAWDMLTGRLAPELGGAPRYVDYVGVNYYHGNQFEAGTERRLHWHLRDPRRMPFRSLLHETFARYERPLVIAETSHFGIGRDRWLVEIAADVRRAMREGVPVAGLCLYPVTDRPDWENPAHWHHSGVWDHVVADDGRCFDRLNLPYVRAIRHVQRTFGDDVRTHGNNGEGTPYALVVLASGRYTDLGWRRRATIEALAAHWQIVFVEGSGAYGDVSGGGDAHASAETIEWLPPRMAIVRAATSQSADAAHDDGAAATVAAILRVLAACDAATYGAWALTAMALPVLAHLAPDVIAYSDDAPEAERSDARFSQRHEALGRLARVVGDVTRPAIEKARQLPHRSGARALLELPGVNADQAKPRRMSVHGARRRKHWNDPREHAECVIVGAGVAGLSAALHYGPGSVLIDRNPIPGGSRRSAADQGFLFDLTAHVLDGRDELQCLYTRLLGDNIGWRAPRLAPRCGAQCDTALLGPFAAAFATADQAIGYPLRGGTQALVDGFLPLLEGDFARGVEVVRIAPHERLIVLDSGRPMRYERLIVTLPLPALLALCAEAVPAEVATAAGRLRTLSLRSIDIGARGSLRTDRDWWLKIGEAIFDRVFLQTNVGPSTRRNDGYALVCEIVHDGSHPLALHGSALVRKCIDDCVRAGLVASPDAVIVTHEVDIPVACVCDDDPQHANLRLIEDWLAAYGIAFTGSRGEWEPGRCAAQVLAGRRAALAARGAFAAAASRVVR